MAEAATRRQACSSPATAAAPPTPSTWRPNWSAASPSTAPGCRRWLYHRHLVLTAIGNDYGYERCFRVRWRRSARPGDVFVGITTSGKSKNVLAAFERCALAGLVTVELCGQGMIMTVVHRLLRVPSSHTPRIQECHILLGQSEVGARRDAGVRPSARRLMATNASESVCIVLAGGLGTRLRTVVSDRPKCLAPVGERPLFALQLDMLATRGIQRFVLSLGHMAQMVQRAISPLQARLRIDTVVEPSRSARAARFCTPCKPPTSANAW